MTTTSTSTSSTDITTLLQQAAQSIISGSTKSTLDVNSLVSALVTAKTAAQSSAITTKQTSDNAELSAIGKIKSSLSSLQTALSGLSDGTSLNQLAVAVSGTGVTASTATGKGAVAGNYTLQVTNIATANKISSQAYTSGASLGSGTLTVGVGSSTMQINVSSSDTLATIANSINTANNNPGVSAAVITAADGQHLVLTSTATGAANTVSVSAGTGLDSGLNTASFTQVTTGKDANFSIDGNAITSASNVITSALTGVNIDISNATANSTQTISITNDTSASEKAINDFVTAYNSYVTTATGLTWDSTQATGSQAGPLLGDSMTNTITNSLGGLVGGGITVGGKTISLSSIGINLQHDGTLSVDSTTLETALSSNSSTVAAVFNQTNGIGTTLNNFINTYTQSSGTIDQRTQNLNTDLSNLSDQATQLTNYQSTLTDQYNAQFSALNTLMTTMQNNTAYLNQLFGGGGLSGSLNSK
ncbi:flagellar filament capping protein FliD [Paraburkholderia sp. Tr-20389]|uniref:flagellar filament capping protein FliD n=1 Tax=Paraburkholderia sp. Tr-20389 TaxID=2703903 RepID=UPI00197F3D4D|nr:flagellar filament capping protein FliD [Paraburkholderia sp. Tr-20389]MBN3752824.1 flagellar filament capping protein FliD [Paraburkholderia sp. Tr-20389]